MAEYNIEILESTLIGPIEQFIKESIVTAFNRFPNGFLRSSYIKHNLDKKFGQHWSCIIGKHFACELSIITEYFIIVNVNDFKLFIFST